MIIILHYSVDMILIIHQCITIIKVVVESRNMNGIDMFAIHIELLVETKSFITFSIQGSTDEIRLNADGKFGSHLPERQVQTSDTI